MLEAKFALRIPALRPSYTWGQWRSFIQSSFYGRTFVAFSGRSMKNYITICFLLKSIEVSVDRTALHGTSAEASASNFQCIQTKNLSKYNCNIPACCV
ncbi:BBF_HP2_G0036420.mRNA.1.CDS.1 [Saccharomyces cerevisiae]|nr:BBF_HP2_G0036420.mRNA.1.CDS.1 [Saccharomyces cerevisiae]CAI6656505.1 BBF_HP2_G0036420.mRNA.1.CDS.1 [Saccharomyces cerevisiae]